ncbi:MAG: gliding motility-associated C-terminal domain-containing protein, partial [Bacteroidetes bacterium]|nr:gliding motility-associated C-terminal domain-containing protein [Bacteroidota bacterium]
KKLLGIYIALFAFGLAQAQSGWSVNPADYQYSMTLTANALIDCDFSLSANDELGVFDGNTCRGHINFGTTVESQQLAYLVIYSNISSGETLNLKVYRDADGVIIDLLESIAFVENASLGSANNPFLLSNNTPPSALNLENILINDLSLMGDTLGELQTIDADNDSYEYSFVNSTTNDNDKFTISDNYILFAQDIDIVTQSSFLVEVEAVAANGCSISNSFILEVLNTNEAPSDILFENDDNIIVENEAAGTLVGVLQVVDPSLADSHVFSLEPGGADNTSFTVDGSNFLSAEIFDYEVRNSYTISVRVTDAAGNFFIKEMEVLIADQIELDDLKANNVITPNGDGYNDYFEVPNISLFENFEFQVYNENGNLVYRRSPSAGYDNLWDGKTTKGLELPSGVYYYVLRDSNNSETVFKGIVNLIRN